MLVRLEVYPPTVGGGVVVVTGTLGSLQLSVSLNAEVTQVIQDWRQVRPGAQHW